MEAYEKLESVELPQRIQSTGTIQKPLVKCVFFWKGRSGCQRKPPHGWDRKAMNKLHSELQLKVAELYVKQFLLPWFLYHRRVGVSAQRSSQLPDGGCAKREGSQPPTLPTAASFTWANKFKGSSDVPAWASVTALHSQLEHSTEVWNDGLAETEAVCLLSFSSTVAGNEPKEGLCAYVEASAELTHTYICKIMANNEEKP